MFVGQKLQIWNFWNFWLRNFFAKICKILPKNRKIENFQFLINRSIWPIFMICKLGKVSMDNFDPNSRYWSNRPPICWKNGFFGLRCPKMAFSHNWKNQFLVEISTKLEYSRKILPPKKSWDVSWYCEVEKIRVNLKMLYFPKL